MKELHIRLEEQCKSGRPFVIYSMPDSGQAQLLLQKDGDVYRTFNFDQPGFIFSPFEPDSKAILIPLSASESIEFSIQDFSTAGALSSAQVLANSESKEKNKHLALVEKAVEMIQKGDLFKVIASRNEDFETNNLEALSLFPILCRLYPSAFVYHLFHPQIGHWLGASPERLISLNGLRFNSVSLAGTRPVVPGQDPDWKQKEIEEQQIVTRFVYDTLKLYSNEIEVSETKNKRAGNLWHLHNSICGELNNQANLRIILNELHPTPAVCGFPRDRALDFIRRNENYNREFYTGYLGPVDPVKQHVDLFVNLRCMSISDDNLRIYVGGGITQDSDPESEWIETVEKAKTMLAVFEV